MRITSGLLVAFSIGSAGCYLRPATTSGPVETPQHVRVSVVDVDCDDDLDDGDVEITPALRVKLKLENPTEFPLELTPEKLELASGGRDTSPGDGPETVTVLPKQTSIVPVHFYQIDGCNKGFDLSFEGALHLSKAPVEVASLRFTE
jgi:hypothetical protein